MLLISLANLAPHAYSVEGVTPVEAPAPGLYVGEHDLRALGLDPDYTLGGVLDDDGYYVWPVTALPEFVGVTVVEGLTVGKQPTPREVRNAAWDEALAYARERTSCRTSIAMFASDFAGYGTSKGMTLPAFEEMYYPNLRRL